MMAVRHASSDFSEARLLLEQLRIAAQSDGASPRSFALLLRRASETRPWEEGFTSFRAYLTTSEEHDGLGLNETAFLHIAELGGALEIAKRLLYGETPAAGEHRGQTVTERTSRERDTHSTAESNKPDTSERVVSRLKRDDPGLAERVISGEVTPNAAARAKGWRKPRIVVSSPERVATSLRKHMSADDLKALARLLLNEEGA